MYAESSYPQKQGDKARLMSVTMKPTANAYPCYLRFYYHMVGQHVGALRVLVRQCVNCKEFTVFEHTTETVDNWIRKIALVRSDKPFQVTD